MSEAPGWEAIDRALHRIYPDQKPLHYGTVRPFRLGGEDPLDGISIYRQDGHWHYIGYGCSELYQKESPDPDTSGFGIEMTFRLKTAPGEAEPPQWPLRYLQDIAKHIFTSRSAFRQGQLIKCGPLGNTDTDRVALLFVEDPQLKRIQTPHGSLTFLQLVGVTEEQMSSTMPARDSTALIQRLQREDPLMVTRLK